MQLDTSNLSYNEFLAYVMIYATGMNNKVTKEELAYIMQKTGVADVDSIKAKIDSMTDAENIELIDAYKQKNLSSPDQVTKARRDIDALLKTPGEHSQLEAAAVHMIERIL